ncbi:hypothetical protein EPN29_00015 [bacterium]|nr:MAG: hypothetical protein EPN29_00015 [bacterium]
MTWLLTHLYRRSIIFWVALAMVISALLIGAYWFMADSMSHPDVQQCLKVLSAFDPSSQREGAPRAGGACSPDALSVLDEFRAFESAISAVLIAIPLALGMFLGAPLIGRELENGTHRLIWVQSVTPVRWIMARMALGVTFAGVLLLLVSGATLPWLALSAVVWQHSPWPGFDMHVTVLLAYGLFAVALGIAAATVSGRTVVAMAVTVCVWAGVRAAFEIILRPNLIPPLIDKGVTAGTAGTNWFLGVTYIDSSGHIVSWDRVNALLASGSLQNYGISLAGIVQPADRFWAFQLIESGFYIVMAAVCAGIAIQWVRLRLARP